MNDRTATHIARDRAIIYVFAACIAALLLQLTPLPAALVARISPAVQISAAGGAWRTISQHPAATLTALAWLIVAMSVFFGARSALTRTAAGGMVAIVLAASVVLGLLGIVQKADWGTPLGLPPAALCTPQFGAFTNANHFAGWMLMTIPLGLGLLCGLLDGSQRSGSYAQATATACAIVVMVVSLFITQSRAGIGVFGLVTLAFLALIARARAAHDRRVVLVGVGLFAAIGVMVVGPTTLAVRFLALDVGTIDGRLQPWTTAVAIARAFPVAGAGLNTYARLAPGFEPAGVRHLDAAHNDYLQLAAEGGLMIALPAAIALAVLAREIARRFQADDDDPMTRWIRAGAAIGLIAVACQEFVDFSLQIPANAVLCAMLFAIASHRPGRAAAFARR